MSTPNDIVQELNARHTYVNRVDVPVKDLPILYGEDPETAQGTEVPEESPFNTHEEGNPEIQHVFSEGAYDPRDFQHQYHSQTIDDQTDVSKMDQEKPIIQTDSESEPDSIFDTDVNYVPSDVVDYYNEATLNAKKRNALPDSAFGLPRLRMYPLTDKSHIKQASRMFGHCKDPEDRKTLANNIFKAAKDQNVELKIGSKNPLASYAPKSIVESSELPQLTVDTSSLSMSKRTKEDVVKEHLRMNGSFYNHIFYGSDYQKAVQAMPKLKFLEFFYPNLTRMDFSIRLHCVCGGLASPENASDIYKELGMREPLDTDFSNPLGWFVVTEEQAEEVSSMLIRANYSAEANWLKADLSDDLAHILFCLRLYSIMGEILLDPNFDFDVNLQMEHVALLMDWYQKIDYYYQYYREAETEKEQRKYQQYLFDIFWNFTDNPNSDEARTANTLSILRAMASVENQVININEGNDDHSLMTKEKCSAYLVHDLGMPDSIFLLPDTLEYPIVNKASIRLAMDMINNIEPEKRSAYIKNLNQKYKEFGCNFSISVDHPYAKYADKNIIQHMSHILLEGDTPVDDLGAKADIESEHEDWRAYHVRKEYMSGAPKRKQSEDDTDVKPEFDISREDYESN